MQKHATVMHWDQTLENTAIAYFSGENHRLHTKHGQRGTPTMQ